MSSTIWTPRALAAKASRRRAELWRAVEAQHIASTMALVDSQAEQDTLESILEHTKPALPPAAAGLHYLLFTPFRYPPTGHGSRFRSATDSGVFYGADKARTACAEARVLALAIRGRQRGLVRLRPVAHTVFLARVDGLAVDLREKPFLKDEKAWTDPASYEATQALAANARRAGIAVIRYESVRDPAKGGCGAVLEPAAIVAPKRPLREQTWFLTVNRTSSAWRRDKEGFEFRWA